MPSVLQALGVQMVTTVVALHLIHTRCSGSLHKYSG
jgi:hypothetical protein